MKEARTEAFQTRENDCLGPMDDLCWFRSHSVKGQGGWECIYKVSVVHLKIFLGILQKL